VTDAIGRVSVQGQDMIVGKQCPTSSVDDLEKGETNENLGVERKPL
jgi:hypothetical protein